MLRLAHAVAQHVARVLLLILEIVRGLGERRKRKSRAQHGNQHRCPDYDVSSTLMTRFLLESDRVETSYSIICRVVCRICNPRHLAVRGGEPHTDNFSFGSCGMALEETAQGHTRTRRAGRRSVFQPGIPALRMARISRRRSTSRRKG